MKSKTAELGLRTDLNLLAFLFLTAVTAVFMALTSDQVLLNTVYLGISIFLLLATYFWGLTAGLVLNLLFIFAQGTWMVYTDLLAGHPAPLALIFWLIMPVLFSVSFYGLVQKTLTLQHRNQELINRVQQFGSFDERTRLRTLVAYQQDGAVYVDTSRRYHLPVSTIALKLRYEGELRRLMTTAQFNELIQIVSQALTASTRTNDMVYLIDRTHPTWAVLLYTDRAGATIAAKRIRSQFAKSLAAQPGMPDVAVTLQLGIADMRDDGIKTPADLIHQAEKATEYDV